MRAIVTSPLDVMLEISNLLKPVFAKALFQRLLRNTNNAMTPTSKSERTASQYLLWCLGAGTGFVPDMLTLTARRRYRKHYRHFAIPGVQRTRLGLSWLSRLSRSRSARISAALWQRRFTSFSSALLMRSSSRWRQIRIQSQWKTGARFRMPSKIIPEVSPRNGNAPSRHLVKHDAEGKQIRASVQLFTAYLFRSHVGYGS